MSVPEELYRVEISAESFYLPEQSEPEESRYAFAYRIRIKNTGDKPAKLVSRHWIIRDTEGGEHQVTGEGVVGEQPLIMPGDTFEYVSGTGLDSPVATMTGSYKMKSEDGTEFEATIPEFMLAAPRVLH